MSEQDFNKGFYDYDLDIKLETQIDLYEQDREKYWEEKLDKDTGEVSKLLYERAERFAKAVLTNTEQLITVQKLDEDLHTLDYNLKKLDKFDEKDFNQQVDDILNSEIPKEDKVKYIGTLLGRIPNDIRDEESPLKLVWERICIDLAWDAISKIKEGAERMLKLYSLILKSSPSKPTQTFLSRLSRCYIRGFDPECVILCRSVVDTAFRDHIHDEICKKHGQYHTNSKGEYCYTLANRVIAAYREKNIDAKTRKKAFIVNERGDKAVHYQPDITKNVWETICDTVAVLEEITKTN